VNIIETLTVPDKNRRLEMYSYDGFYFVAIYAGEQRVYFNRHLAVEHAKKELDTLYWAETK
jgi:hypothetical protein